MSEPQGIYKAMCDAMADITAITKDRTNVQQNFKFRGIDDVYNELHSILAKHRIFTMPEVLEDRTEERQTKSGGNLIYRVLKIKHHFCHEDGSSITSTVIGEGMDSGDKASNKAMAIGHKYSLFQAFLIPTEDEKDPDGQSHDVKPKAKPAEKKPEPPKEPVNPSSKTTSSGLSQRDKQTAIKAMLTEIYINETDAADALFKMTTWEKDGVTHEGKRSAFELNMEVKPGKKQSQTDVYYHEVKKLYDGWKAAQEKEAQSADHESA